MGEGGSVAADCTGRSERGEIGGVGGFCAESGIEAARFVAVIRISPPPMLVALVAGVVGGVGSWVAFACSVSLFL